VEIKVAAAAVVEKRPLVELPLSSPQAALEVESSKKPSEVLSL